MLGGVTLVTLSMILLSGNVGAQDFRELKEKIEKERQIQVIKSSIISQVKRNLGPSMQLAAAGNSYGRPDAMRDNLFPPPIPEGWQSTPMPTRSPADPQSSRPLIILGNPASSERDGCLNFAMSRGLKQPATIRAVKLDLFVHITKEGKKRSRSSRNTERRARRRREKSPKRKNKSKKKRKGKRVKLSVSNGSKRLAKLRMRVTKTHWFNIELPISQFPKEISSTDTFKLCVACKRCKKKIRLDLYRDTHDNTTDLFIPFIHIQPVSHLPQRSKRSSDVFQNGVRETGSDISGDISVVPTCCKEEIYSTDINVPYLLQPKMFNFSLCETLPSSESRIVSTSTNTLNNLLSKDSSRAIQRKCVSASYESFTYSFIDTDLKVTYASIPYLIPRGCKCVDS